MWNQATNITALTYFSFFKAASQSTLSDNGNVLGLCNVLHMQPLPGKTWWRKHSTNDLLKNKAINCPKKLETHNQWCLGINEHLIIGWQVLSCSADLKILLWSYARSSPLVGRKALQHCMASSCYNCNTFLYNFLTILRRQTLPLFYKCVNMVCTNISPCLILWFEIVRKF